MEFGTGGGALRFAPIVLRSGEESFEAGPSFFLCGEIFPEFAVVDKETGMVDKLESDANDLFEALGSVTGGGVVTGILTLLKRDSIGWFIS